MKIIAECPICGVDFMYDPTWDTKQCREVAWDPDTGQACSHDFICVDCMEELVAVDDMYPDGWTCNVCGKEFHDEMPHPDLDNGTICKNCMIKSGYRWVDSLSIKEKELLANWAKFSHDCFCASWLVVPTDQTQYRSEIIMEFKRFIKTENIYNSEDFWDLRDYFYNGVLDEDIEIWKEDLPKLKKLIGGNENAKI